MLKSTLTTLLIVALATPAFAQGSSPSLREAAHHAALAEPPTQIRRTSRQSWPAQHPVLLGTLAGAGLGAVYGAATCISPIAEGNGSCDGYTDTTGIRSAAALYGAAWGAGIGALVGLAVKVAIH